MSNFGLADPAESLFANKVETLRKQDCHRLCDAFGIPYDPKGTKSAVLPYLIRLEVEGKLKAELAPNPEFLKPPSQRALEKKQANEEVVKIKPTEKFYKPAMEEEPPVKFTGPKWRGPKAKWGAVKDDEILQDGFATKDEAEEYLNGLHSA